MSTSNYTSHSHARVPSPKNIRDAVLQRQARNDKRLLSSCALASAAVLGPGLAGALFDVWPAIVAGFILGCVVLAMEWGRWRNLEKVMNEAEIQALSAWIESQDDPFLEARKPESGHYGPVISRVALHRYS